MKKLLLSAAMATMSGCFPVSTCVARGSRVSTRRGLINIEDLSVGDEVTTVDPIGRASASTTLTAIRSAQRECGMISFSGGSLEVTTDHPLFDPVTGTFEPAGDCLLGKRTQLLRFEGQHFTVVEVTGVQAFSRLETVFDLTVEHDWHTFVAEGVVVHNKSPVYFCALPDGGRLTDSQPAVSCTCADGGVSELVCDYPTNTAVCDGCDSNDAGIDAGP